VSELTDAIAGVCRLVTADPSAAAVARELGDVVATQTNALEVRMRDERFGDVYVVHTDDEVSHVDLALREPATLDDFGAAFGNGREAPPMPHRPRSLHFERPGATIIARFTDEGVVAVTVRRD
jgi:hypothetical protein